MVNFVVLATDLLWWTLFGALHSISASFYVKSKIPLSDVTYRIVYNIISTLLFTIVLLHVSSPFLLVKPVFNINIWRVIGSLFFFVLGGGILAWGASEWDFRGFIGLSKEMESLVVDGPYALSRHPVYSGIILMVFSPMVLQVSAASLSWFIGVTGYFFIGSIFEENKLERIMGEPYTRYKQKVARFFPINGGNLRYLWEHANS